MEVEIKPKIEEIKTIHSKLLFSRFEFPEPSKKQQLKHKKKVKRLLKDDRNLWAKTELKASGIKIKDDPVLMKRTEIRKMRLKKKSEKFWQKQKEMVNEKIQSRQQKRMDNIQKKKEQKRKLKHKRAEKRGRVIIK